MEFSRRALRRVVELDGDVVGVFTKRLPQTPTDNVDLTELCTQLDVRCMRVENINSDHALDAIRGLRPDVLFCFGWSQLLKAPLLQIAPLGVVGFHPTALPANRGRHPLIWALVLGLRNTGSTFFFMDGGADSGDILSQRAIRIDDRDDAASLYEKVTATALLQIEEFLPLLANGKHHRQKQNELLATTWRKRTPADGQIDWRMSAGSVSRLVRALTRPYPGAHFLCQEQVVKLWRATIVEDVWQNAEPGKIVGYVDGSPVVKCGEQALRLAEMEPIVAPAVGAYL